MTLLQINSIFEGNYEEELKKNELVTTVTESELDQFRELLLASESFVEGLSKTESSAEYFQTFELLDKSVRDEIKEDVFYASKLGFFYEGIPSKIVYLLRKAIRKYNTPNNAISSLDVRSIGRYLKKGSLPEGVTLKKIMENLIGREITLLSQYKRSSVFKDDCEIYVENTDRVLIISKELVSYVNSREDLNSIAYVKNVGVCVQGIPIRTLGGHVGLTMNEYDLRDCK